MLPDLAVFFAAGVGVGLATAAVPGPIVILLIVETLKYGWRAGAAVAMAPVIVDGVVILPLAMILQSLMVNRQLLLIFGVASALFLIFLGVTMLGNARRENLERFEHEEDEIAPVKPYLSFRKALGVHLLSPLAYGFWGTVGAYWLHRTSNYLYVTGIRGAANWLLTPPAFGLGFWCGTLIVAAAIITAASAGRRVFRSWLYQGVLAVGGVAMIGFGLYTAVRVFTR